jgi:hypothetical protein
VARQAATTYYAAPAGSGTACSAATPCDIGTALGKPAAGAGDLVQLAGGNYTGATLALAASDATLQGTLGAGRPVIQRVSVVSDWTWVSPPAGHCRRAGSWPMRRKSCK